MEITRAARMAVGLLRRAWKFVSAPSLGTIGTVAVVVAVVLSVAVAVAVAVAVVAAAVAYRGT